MRSISGSTEVMTPLPDESEQVLRALINRLLRSLPRSGMIVATWEVRDVWELPMSIKLLEFRHLKDQGLFVVRILRRFLRRRGANAASCSVCHGTRSDPSPVVLLPAALFGCSAPRNLEVDKAWTMAGDV